MRFLCMEAALNRETPCGKRNYAMSLLATRLGVRSGDIAAMTLDELDFETDSIRFNQRKTGGEQTLPMLTEIRAALLDYIQNARGNSGSPYVFLRTQPPRTRLSILTIGKLVRECIRDGGVCPSDRKQGGLVLCAPLWQAAWSMTMFPMRLFAARWDTRT